MDAQLAALLSKKPVGFVVHFERHAYGSLYTEYYPDKGQVPTPPFTSAEAAWEVAAQIAAANQLEIINVFVVDANTYIPVPGYLKRTLNVGR